MGSICSKGKERTDETADVALVEGSWRLKSSRKRSRAAPSTLPATLQDICVLAAAQNLPALDLSPLPPDLAQRIFDEAVASDVLDECLLHKFEQQYLHSFDVEDCPGVSDAWLQCLRHVDNLRNLNLRNCNKVTDKGLEFLKTARKLRSITLSGCPLVSNAVVVAASSLPMLQELDLERCEAVTPHGVSFLMQLHNLRSLNLQSCHVGTAIQCLCVLNKLEVLKMGWALGLEQCSALLHLGFLTSLRELYLNNTQVSCGAGLRYLAGLQRLQLLDLSACDLAPSVLQPLAALPRLRVLRLSRTLLADSGLQALASAPALEELDVSYTLVSDPGLLSLAPLTTLTSLLLDSCPRVTCGACPVFSHLRALRRLDLSDTSVGDAGVARLARLSALRHLNLSYTLATDAATPALRPLTALTFLSLDSRLLGDASLRHASVLRNLRRLELFGSRVGDAGLAHLAPLTALTALEACTGRITDHGCAVVAQHLRELAELNLAQNARITTRGVVVLAGGLPRLQALNLANTGISSPALQPLANLQELAVLSVRHTRVSDAAVRALRQSRPHLVIKTTTLQAPACAPP